MKLNKIITNPYFDLENMKRKMINWYNDPEDGRQPDTETKMLICMDDVEYELFTSKAQESYNIFDEIKIGNCRTINPALELPKEQAEYLTEKIKIIGYKKYKKKLIEKYKNVAVKKETRTNRRLKNEIQRNMEDQIDVLKSEFKSTITKQLISDEHGIDVNKDENETEVTPVFLHKLHTTNSATFRLLVETASDIAEDMTYIQTTLNKINENTVSKDSVSKNLENRLGTFTELILDMQQSITDIKVTQQKQQELLNKLMRE